MSFGYEGFSMALTTGCVFAMPENGKFSKVSCEYERQYLYFDSLPPLIFLMFSLLCITVKKI